MSGPAPHPSTCTRCGAQIAAGQYVLHQGSPYCLACTGEAIDSQLCPRQGAPRPTLAILLSLLPGLGQMYNRQMRKGMVVMFAFLALAIAEPLGSLNPAVLVALFFWNLFDAYWGAASYRPGAVPPEADLEEQIEAGRREWESRVANLASPPLEPSMLTTAWAILLITLGVLFLLGNFAIVDLSAGWLLAAAVLAIGLWLALSALVGTRLGEQAPPAGPGSVVVARSAVPEEQAAGQGQEDQGG